MGLLERHARLLFVDNDIVDDLDIFAHVLDGPKIFYVGLWMCLIHYVAKLFVWEQEVRSTAGQFHVTVRAEVDWATPCIDTNVTKTKTK